MQSMHMKLVDLCKRSMRVASASEKNGSANWLLLQSCILNMAVIIAMYSNMLVHAMNCKSSSSQAYLLLHIFQEW